MVWNEKTTILFSSKFYLMTIYKNILSTKIRLVVQAHWKEMAKYEYRKINQTITWAQSVKTKLLHVCYNLNKKFCFQSHTLEVFFSSVDRHQNFTFMQLSFTCWVVFSVQISTCTTLIKANSWRKHWKSDC